MTPKWLIAGMVNDRVYHISPRKFSRVTAKDAHSSGVLTYLQSRTASAFPGLSQVSSCKMKHNESIFGMVVLVSEIPKRRGFKGQLGACDMKHVVSNFLKASEITIRM